MKDLLAYVHTWEVTVSSDYARGNAPDIAMAASMGLITTKLPGGLYGRVWRLTAGGLRTLEQMELESE